jgi:hypothetical protein
MPLTNTLETARRLESLGFSHQQAQGFAELFEVTAQDARKQLVPRGDLGWLWSQFAELRAEIKVEIAGLRAAFRDELREQTLWYCTVLTALLGIAVAVIKLFP